MPQGSRSGGRRDQLLPGGPLINRRQFLSGAAAAVGGLAAMGMAGKKSKRHTVPAHAKHHPHHHTQAQVIRTALDSGVVVPTARWLVAENAKPGTNNWVVTGIQTPHAIEGFASQVSAAPGDDLVLFVNTNAQSFHVEAYRMGYYQGLGGRLIDTSDTVAGTQQPTYTVTPGVNTVTCPWQPSMTLSITNDWPPGNYLLKLVGDGGQQQYIPLTVRDDTSTATYVFQNSVSTWQAYNLWGGYSLYGHGATGGDFGDRSRIVSFDRPYPQTWAQGAADFFGNEFPVLYQMEQHGLDMTYWTDVDLHANPSLLSKHKTLFTMGHDEYWSYEMRDGSPERAERRHERRLSRRQRGLPADPALVVPGRVQPAADLLQGRRRGPAQCVRTPVHDRRLEPGAAQQPRELSHRQHVPVGRGERRPGRHRQLVVVLERHRPVGRDDIAKGGPGRVRPLRPLTPGAHEPGRLRALTDRGPSKLVRYDLLHRLRRRRGLRVGYGFVRLQAVQHD